MPHFDLNRELKKPLDIIRSHTALFGDIPHLTRVCVELSGTHSPAFCGMFGVIRTHSHRFGKSISVCALALPCRADKMAPELALASKFDYLGNGEALLRMA